MVAFVNRYDRRSVLSSYLCENLRHNYVFSPLYGLGDRSTFYALLGSFEVLLDTQVRVLCFGERDPLIKLFPNLIDKTVILDGHLALEPLTATHWMYGEDHPKMGSIYFTWHQQFLGGHIATSWTNANDPRLTHKALIKNILGLSQQAEPARLTFGQETNGRAPCLVIAPIANSSEVSVDWYLSLMSLAASNGIRIVVNIGNRDTHEAKYHSREQYLLSRLSGTGINVDIFTGNVCELLELCAQKGTYTVSSRSGLCELLSLAHATYAIIGGPVESAFWSLEGWGSAPTYTAKIEDVNERELLTHIANHL